MATRSAPRFVVGIGIVIDKVVSRDSLATESRMGDINATVNYSDYHSGAKRQLVHLVKPELGCRILMGIIPLGILIGEWIASLDRMAAVEHVIWMRVFDIW